MKLMRQILIGKKMGATSVLLMVLLASMLLFVGVVTEAASKAAAGSYVQSVAVLAGRSVLSMYDESLQQEYGLFAVRDPEAELKRQLSYYIQASLSPEVMTEVQPAPVDALQVRLDELSISVDDFALTSIKQLEKQIRDFMRYRVIGDFALAMDSSNGKRRVQEAAQQMKQASVELAGMEGDREKIQEAQTLFEQADDLLKETLDLKSRWEQWNRCAAQGETEQAAALKEELIKRWNSIRKRMRTTVRAIDQLQGQLDDQRQTQRQLKKDLGEIRADLLRRDSVSVEQLPSLFEELEQKKGMAILERLRLRGVIHGYQKNKEESEDDTRIRQLKNQKTIASLPSVLMEGDTLFPFSFEQNLSDEFNLEQRLYTVSYIQKQCASRTKDSQRPSFFQHEMEYILAGFYSDKQNAQVVWAELFALRTAANLVHIYSDASKRSEIEIMAAALTPGPGMVLTEFLIAMAWSCGEARYDMKCLLEGQRVPIVKSAKQWKLSLKAAVTGSVPTVSAGSETTGFSYNEYLTLFLFVQPKEIQLCRLMDLIQLNMQGQYDESFELQNCYGGFRSELQVSRMVPFGFGTGKASRISEMEICHEY